MVAGNGLEYRLHTGIFTIPSLSLSGAVGPRIVSTGYLVTALHDSYPTDNCGAQFDVGDEKNSQTELPNYLTHNSVTSLVAPYINSTSVAQESGKPFVMLETNTASCGGFGGVSDAFAAALWAADYALQMAYANFSMAMFHTGGINVFYNVCNNSFRS